MTHLPPNSTVWTGSGSARAMAGLNTDNAKRQTMREQRIFTTRLLHSQREPRAGERYQFSRRRSQSNQFPIRCLIPAVLRSAYNTRQPYCCRGPRFMDHDQRFKTLIQFFFQDFLLLFFKSWAERLDASAVEWLDKEVFPDPPEGQRQILDLVGKLSTRRGVPGQRAGEVERWLALVHI